MDVHLSLAIAAAVGGLCALLRLGLLCLTPLRLAKEPNGPELMQAFAQVVRPSWKSVLATPPADPAAPITKLDRSA